MDCIIIEDEKASQEILLIKLKKFFPDICVKAVIDDYEEAIAYLQKSQVDLVFLDNQVKGGTGVNLLSYFPKRSFQVIMVSAFPEYAVDALNQSVIFYLLKPFKDCDFRSAVEKGIEASQRSRPFLVVHAESDHLVFFDELLYVSASGTYTKFFLDHGKVIWASKNLGFFEEKLPEKYFFRIHHSYIINLNKVTKISRGKTTEVFLKGISEPLPVSQRRVKAFLSMVKS